MSAPREARLLGALLVATSLMTIGPRWAPTVSAAPASVTVDTTEDTFDGSCEDGDCSLRDAVKSAAVGARVLVPSGFYALTRAGRGGVGVGTIELSRRVEIVGEGETGAFIDASALGAPAFATSPPAGSSPRFTIEHLTLFGARDTTLVGGAIRARGGRLRLVDSTLTGGVAERGGGIAVGAGAAVRIEDTLITDNEAAARGGAVWNDGSLLVVDSAIVANTAGDGGGVGASGGATTSLGNSTVALNTAGGRGGGLWLAGPAVIAFATIGYNGAARGGGIAVAGSAAGAVEVGATIVAENEAGPSRQCSGSISSLGDNVEQGHGCGFDVRGDLEDTDPMLRRLGANGGPTPTMPLASRSPASGLAGDCGGRDQRGAPRDRRCDAGGYEIVRCLGRPVNVVGTPHDEELSGGRGRDVFLGLGGDDEFQGSIGRDRACGGPGNDLLIAGPGKDRFSGEAGNDVVKGEAGDDVVWGGAGRDRLVGGPGLDSCEAGGGDRASRGCEISFVGTPRSG